jgi:hypothetical protein
MTDTLREAALALVRQAELSLDYRPEFRRAIANAFRAATIPEPRFPMTYCSQCGTDLGAGNAGVSHCSDHQYRHLSAIVEDERN